MFKTLPLLLTALIALSACSGGGGSGGANTPTPTDCSATPFHADCDTNEDAQTARQTTCLADPAANAACTGAGGIATLYCTDTPFATDLACAGAPYALMRQTLCLANPTANGGCLGDGGFATPYCTNTPFATDPACADASFEPLRIDHCITAGNASNDQCTGEFAMDSCVLAPFGAGCNSQTYSAQAQGNRVDFCVGDMDDTDLCTTAIRGCIAAPFGAGCKAVAYDAIRTERVIGCVAVAKASRATDNACAGILDRPNAATWLQSHTPALGTVEITANRPADGSYEGIFLQASATGLDSGMRPLRVLTFDTAFDDGNTDDGVAYFNNASRHYAGILSGTDLGAALPVVAANNGDVIAKWQGFIQTSGGFATPTAFTLLVNLTDSELKAFIPRTDGNTVVAFTIEGSFITKGVISGTVERGIYTDNTDQSTYDMNNGLNSAGELTGIIGNAGAVATFVSDDGDVSSPYSGGFVARNPAVDGMVNVNDLPTYPTARADITKSGFLSPTADGLDMTNLPADRVADFSFTDRRGGGADSTNPDGFAYYRLCNEPCNSQVAFDYIGILPTTDLGAPLTATTGTATWAGHLSLGEDVRNRTVNFHVDFGAGRFGFSNATDDGFGTQSYTVSGTIVINILTLNGAFGSHAYAMGLPAGRMAGHIDINGTLDVPLVGLIGAEGAVGIFTEEGQAGTFTGGFTATNPSQ